MKIAEEDFECKFCDTIVLKGQEYDTVFNRMGSQGEIIPGDPACKTCTDGYYNSFW